MPITTTNPFKGRQYPGEVILLAVRWYLRYPRSYEHVAELLGERGVEVDASCIWRWVQAYAPEINKRCRPHLKPVNKSYRIDETYLKVKGKDRYLYRAVDSTGQTIEFLLTAKRDTAAAKRFLLNAIAASGNAMPRVMNVDKNPAYPAAVEEMKAEGILPRRVRLRQCKYLNNIVEIVFTQMTKTSGFPTRMRRDHVSDLYLIVNHQHPIDEQLQNRALLHKAGVG
jgi:transposase-like protein